MKIFLVFVLLFILLFFVLRAFVNLLLSKNTVA